MKHRGPDEKGIWKSEYFSFGMSSAPDKNEVNQCGLK